MTNESTTNPLLALALILGVASGLAAQDEHPSARPDAPPAAAPQRKPVNPDGAGAAPDHKARARGEPVVLEPMVITATRTAKDPFEIAGMAAVLDRHDLVNRRLVRTAPEALRETPGVLVQKTGHGQGSPFIRGFTGFRTLFLIDGIRLNNSVFRDGPNQYWNTVDPFSLDRLEVVKGPGSVLYGSDAIGGTVHALTRRRQRFDPGFHWNRRVYYRYASAEASHTGRGEVSANLDHRFGLLLGATIKDYGDLVGGRDVGRQRKTGYREWDGDVKVEYFLGPREKLVFAHQRVDLDDAWRTHKTIYGVRWEGTTAGSERKRILDQDRHLTYVQYHADDLGGFIDTVRASLSYQVQAEERFRVKKDGKRDRQGFSAGTTGAWVQLGTPSELGRFTCGADFYFDNVSSFKHKYNASGQLTGRAIQGPVADNARYALAGVFVEDEIPVTNRLDLILGGRFTYARVSAHDVENPDPQTKKLTPKIAVKDRFSQLTGSLRGLYRLDRDDRWHVFAGVSQGFRAPNLSDLTRLDTARSDEIETPSPGLDPESFLAFEVGLKTRHTNLRGEVSAWYTAIDDMIVRTPTGRKIGNDHEVTKKNEGYGYAYGFEVSASYRFHPRFTAFGSFAVMDSSVRTFPTKEPDSEREPLSRQMPPAGSVGVRWTGPKRKLWAEGVVAFAARADKLSTRDRKDTQRIPPGGTPAYAVITLRGGVQVDANLDLTAAIENLTNQDYRIHGSGLNEPGTSVVLAADWRF